MSRENSKTMGSIARASSTEGLNEVNVPVSGDGIASRMLLRVARDW